MQIIFPGQHASFTGFILILFSLVALFSVLFIFIALKKQNKSSKGAFLTLSILSLSFMLFNCINYYVIDNDLSNQQVGIYRDSTSNTYIHLKQNREWISNYTKLRTKRGYWKYTINEDWSAIHLYKNRRDKYSKDDFYTYGNVLYQQNTTIEFIKTEE